MEVSKDTINKVLTEFMGKDASCACGYEPLFSGYYTDSLDAQIPVMYKLSDRSSRRRFDILLTVSNTLDLEYDTAAEAVARELYKAITNLKEVEI